MHLAGMNESEWVERIRGAEPPEYFMLALALWKNNAQISEVVREYAKPLFGDVVMVLALLEIFKEHQSENKVLWVQRDKGLRSHVALDTAFEALWSHRDALAAWSPFGLTMRRHPMTSVHVSRFKRRWHGDEPLATTDVMEWMFYTDDGTTLGYGEERSPQLVRVFFWCEGLDYSHNHERKWQHALYALVDTCHPHFRAYHDVCKSLGLAVAELTQMKSSHDRMDDILEILERRNDGRHTDTRRLDGAEQGQEP